MSSRHKQLVPLKTKLTVSSFSFCLSSSNILARDVKISSTLEPTFVSSTDEDTPSYMYKLKTLGKSSTVGINCYKCERKIVKRKCDENKWKLFLSVIWFWTFSFFTLRTPQFNLWHLVCLLWWFRTYLKQYLSTGILVVVFWFTVFIFQKYSFSPELKGLRINFTHIIISFHKNGKLWKYK